MTMFVCTVTYLDMAKVEEALGDHKAWLDRNYEAEVFLASGGQVPRVGGIIIAAGIEREELEALVATDPFALAGAATHAITEFRPTKTAACLAAYRVS